MKLRAYVNIKPHETLGNPADIADRLYDYIGPAVPDRSGWGLLRPGILTRRLVTEVCNLWRAERSQELVVQDRPQIRGSWIFFDYFFTKATAANPIIKCLTNLGLAKYGETRLTNTYVVTAGLNYENGLLLLLYNGKKIETELDELAYVVSHIIKAVRPRIVEVTQRLLIELATHLQSSPRWQLKGWISRDGRSVELDLVEKRREEYLAKLREGEWRSLLFQDKYSKIKLTLGPRIKVIDVAIKKRDLKPIFEEISNGIRIDSARDITLSGADEAGILRAYTERRGVMATIKLERNMKGRDAFDLSYDFQGYDVKSGPELIEVKAFRDSAYKAIELTKNEYETMNREENYRIYVVEDAWDDIPKVSIIADPRTLLFIRLDRTIFETRTTSEEYFECSEDKWRGRVAASYNVI